MKKAMWYVLLVSAFVVVFVISSCQVAPTSPGEDEIQPGATFSGSGDYLTPHDHTLIVKAVGDNLLGPYGVLANLDTIGGVTGTKVLEAALKVEAIPDSVKEKIKVVLKYAPVIEERINDLSLSKREAINEILAKLDNASTPEEAKQILIAVKQSGKYNSIEGMEAGLEFAIGMVGDGIGSIYSPDYEPGYAPHICINNRGGGGHPQPDTSRGDSTSVDSTDTFTWAGWADSMVAATHINWKGILKADVSGALSGAIMGGVGGPAGAATGAGWGAVWGSTLEFYWEVWF